MAGYHMTAVRSVERLTQERDEARTLAEQWLMQWEIDTRHTARNPLPWTEKTDAEGD